MMNKGLDLNFDINPTANSCADKSAEFLRQDKESDCSKALCLTNELDAVIGEKRPAFGARDCRWINIKIIVCDVDGVLTDGKMIYTENGDEIKNFHTRDGIAAQELKAKGYMLIIISSGHKKDIIERRAKFLKFDEIVVTSLPKDEILDGLADKHHFSYDEILYIGDDINDIPAMKKCAVSCCPSDAYWRVKELADIVLNTKGGGGCLREVSDILLYGIIPNNQNGVMK
jgi:YrbI family 3-deoxy-D-manno-octulosonate 8-phosphate phosphatase